MLLPIMVFARGAANPACALPDTFVWYALTILSGEEELQEVVEAESAALTGA